MESEYLKCFFFVIKFFINKIKLKKKLNFKT